jgi:hypothetical protein
MRVSRGLCEGVGRERGGLTTDGGVVAKRESKRQLLYRGSKGRVENAQRRGRPSS